MTSVGRNEEAMPDSNELHLNGDIFFVFATMPVQQIGPYRSAIHLIEHEVRGFAFGYGVAKCEATESQIGTDFRGKEITDAASGYSTQPLDSRLKIVFEDGRIEMVRKDDCRIKFSPEGDGCQIAFTLEIRPGH
jgi:hypothetical protein